MQQLTKWLNKVVSFIIALTVLALPQLHAQTDATLELGEAFALAEKNYPLTRQKVLIREKEGLNIDNLNSNFLPRPSLNGQATYQSDVTSLSVPIPGFKVPEPPKDQYKLTAELNQLLYDGGLTRGQKNVARMNALLETNKVGVELYQLKSRVQQLFFSILLHDELLEQTRHVIRDVAIGIDKVKPQVENGVVLRSNLQLLQVQLLQSEQKATEIKTAREGLIDALSEYLGEDIDTSYSFSWPPPARLDDSTITRPELQVFESESLLLDAKESLVSANNKPKASAFLQGGMGRPGLNFLSDELKGFYITGIRLTWPLEGFYNAKRDKQIINIGRQTNELQKESFLLNLRTQLKQQQSDIRKYQLLMTSDQQIIDLRHAITESAKAQLENAVITANDYLQQVNAEDAARQNLIVHHLQLKMAETNYLITTGKL